MKSFYLNKLVVLMCIVCLLFSCSLEPDSPVSVTLGSLNFDEGKILLVKEVEKLNKWVKVKQKSNDSTHMYFFENILVQDLYKNPYSHFEYTKAIVADAGVRIEIKKLLIRLSQCVSLNDYMILGETVFNTGSPDLIAVYISPGSEYGYILSEYYSNDKVVNYLQKVSQQFPSLSGTVGLIESGTNINRINAYKNVGESLPVLKCE